MQPGSGSESSEGTQAQRRWACREGLGAHTAQAQAGTGRRGHRPPRKRQVQGGAKLWRGSAWASHLSGGGPREGRFLGVSPQRRWAQREVEGGLGGATS